MYTKVDGSREYLFLKETNNILVEENAQLRNSLQQMEQRLDSSVVLSEFNDPYQYHFVPSRVIHNSVYKQYNYLTLDHGEKDGVFRDMGVISDQGVVGIVLETSDNFATVIPIINLDFRLSVKLKSSNYAGILQWGGKSPLFADLNEIPFHVDLLENDTIVTSGFSSIFPEGIEVGTIESFSLGARKFLRNQGKALDRLSKPFPCKCDSKLSKGGAVKPGGPIGIMYIIARNIFRFFVVIAFQILVMDNVMINGYMVPYIYLLFILLMPFDTPRWIVLLSGFILGFGIDLFEHTPGMHTAATVLIAFVRPYILNLLAPRDGYEPETFPRIYYYGFAWFLKYTLLIVLVHHLALFYLEVFQLQNFLSTLLRVILSTALSASTIVLSQYFVFRK